MCEKKHPMRLTYFNSRGRAELIRWILAYGKAEWEDVRINPEDWPKVKPTMPLGQVPILEGDCEGKHRKLSQTGTIIRACAHWFGLCGKNPLEALEADEAFEVLREVFEVGVIIYLEPEKERKEKLGKKLQEEISPRNFTFLEEKLKANGGKFVAGGENFTYADLAIACYVDGWRSYVKPEDMEKCSAKYPGIFDVCKRVEENPEIKAWLAKRPKTDH